MDKLVWAHALSTSILLRQNFGKCLINNKLSTYFLLSPQIACLLASAVRMNTCVLKITHNAQGSIGGFWR